MAFDESYCWMEVSPDLLALIVCCCSVIEGNLIILNAPEPKIDLEINNLCSLWATVVWWSAYLEVVRGRENGN